LQSLQINRQQKTGWRTTNDAIPFFVAENRHPLATIALVQNSHQGDG
jgi:hypothetical protein